MSDIIDAASDVVLECTAEAERRIRKLVLPETHPEFDGEHCVSCEVVIPGPRLVMGKVRCVSCQQDLEQRNRTRIGWMPEGE